MVRKNDGIVKKERKNMNQKVELFVPGRLCLFGEHTDWAGRYSAQNAEVPSGKAIVTGINLGIYATAEECEEFWVESFDDEGNYVEFRCEMHTETLRNAALEPSFFCYCCGVASYLRENYHVSGIHIKIDKVTLPTKKGLSSSAAICVLVAKAFNEVYSLSFSTRGIMRVAYSGERLTMSRCGRLDQACAFGSVPVLMEFLDEDIFVEKLQIGKNFYWVIADLEAKKDTKKILSSLNGAYPFAQTEIDKNVQYALGKANHEIIERAVDYMATGNDVALGNLMVEAQKLFDEKVAPACPEELKAPVLHSVLNDSNIQEWILGGKGVGSQGDGTVQFLAKDKEAQMKLVEYLNSERKMNAFPFEISAGDKVRKAIIPIAGFGTRMYPETHFIKKAFLPIIDSNRIVKPVILSILEELNDEGIEEIILVVGEDEVEDFKKVFEYEFDSDFERRLPNYVASYYKLIHRIGKKIKYAIQHERRGFGHAVYQAGQFLNGEPALLLLGDFIYQSNLDYSCTRQTLNAYNKSGGKAIVSIKEVPLEDVVHYGIISGEFDDQRSYMMHVTNMVEKPSVEYAKGYLSCPDENGKERFFATFGQYVLTTAVFEFLKKQIDEQKDVNREIDLTKALYSLIKEEKLDAVRINGRSFDVGIPDAYFNSFNAFFNS